MSILNSPAPARPSMSSPEPSAGPNPVAAVSKPIYRVEAPPRPEPGRAGRQAKSGRMEAIARGEAVPAEVHEAVGREDRVLEIEKFRLWYGPKQALFDISMGVPR